MLNKEELRRIEVKLGDEWVSAEWGQLQVGDRFRMFEPDNSPVVHEGCDIFVVYSPPCVSVKYRQDGTVTEFLEK